MNLRTVEERDVCIAGDREPLLDGIEQLPNDLLSVGTTYRPMSNAALALNDVTIAHTKGNGHLLRRVAWNDDES